MLPFQKLDQEFVRKAGLYKTFSFVAMGLLVLYVLIALLILRVLWRFRKAGIKDENTGETIGDHEDLYADEGYNIGDEGGDD